jgi:hypothetical protein
VLAPEIANWHKNFTHRAPAHWSKRDQFDNPIEGAPLRSGVPASKQAQTAVPLVDIIGELDLNSALGQLANARYTSESAAPAGGRVSSRQGPETLSVLTTLSEVRAAVNEIGTSARRLISIYTPDLEPEIYDQTSFLEVVKHFVLTRSFSKVRVLLAEPTRVMRDSNRFVAMGRRLSSCIDIRYVAAKAPQRASAYLIADDRAIMYRMRADTWDGIADVNNPPVARLYLQEFDTIWNASAVDHGLRVVRRG